MDRAGPEASESDQHPDTSWRAPTPRDSWPVPEGDDVVFMTEVAAPTERHLIDRWIETHRPAGTAPAQVRVLYIDRPGSGTDLVPQEGRVRSLVAAPGDPWLVPVRVAWRPRVREADRSVRLRDVLLLGDPRRPRASAQRLLARRDDRHTVVNGGAARRSWLERRWRRQTGAGSDGTSFPHFLLLQGILSMERAEAELLGAQYKVPRMVREDLSSGVRFQSGLAELAASLGRPLSEVRQESTGYLDEMVTGYGRLLIDLSARLGRFVYRQGYDLRLDYDPEQVERVRSALGDHPAVILPTHRSMLDPMVMPAAFAELGLPRSHTLGGINLAFWPLGPIMRRSGIIFIRRRISDNPVYRFTLREYIGYLVEKRFSLEWYIEGGRTRTGKLLPPRLGLLAYVADAFWQGRAEDVMLLPVAIAYDQLHEVSAFAHEARGGAKEREDLRWAVNYVRAQRSNFGRISVRFGEPVSMRAMLGPPPPVTGGSGRPDQLALQKMAFEVAVRINQVTPITASALVTFALLGASDRALTLDQLEGTLADPLAFVAERHLPLAESARRLSSAGGVRATLADLQRHHVVSAYEEGTDPVFLIAPDGHHAAAFYRNAIVHFFLTTAIGELAALRAGDTPDHPIEAFWAEAAELRDLLKFDFFFPDKAEFQRGLGAEMTRQDPEWERQLAGRASGRQVLATFSPLCSHVVLRSFLEAYVVVADVLVEWGTAAVDEKRAVERCLRVGQQYLLQGRLRRPDAISQILFATGLSLAANRNLTGAGQEEGPEVTNGRLEALTRARMGFAAQLRRLLRAVDVVEDLATAQLDRRVNVSASPARPPVEV